MADTLTTHIMPHHWVASTTAQHASTVPVHVLLLEVFDGHRDVVLPHQDLLVVRCAHELAAVVEEGDGVAGLQVVVVLLTHRARAAVPLVNLVVGGCAQEDVVVVRMKLHCKKNEIKKRR